MGLAELPQAHGVCPPCLLQPFYISAALHGPLTAVACPGSLQIPEEGVSSPSV